MEHNRVEERLETLEQQVRHILDRIELPANSSQKSWRRSLGMFDNRPLMKQIDEEGHQIRQKEREQASVDNS